MRCCLAAIALLAFVLVFYPEPGRSAQVSLGHLSFDTLIPGTPDSPGVNVFTIGNLTGDPLSGGNAVPPSFPVLSTLTFTNSSLVLISEGTSQTIDLGDIGPGFFEPSILEFPESTSFFSAIFSATLDATTFDLDGGATFGASSAQITATLLPSGGNTLSAGVDFTLITASDQAGSVPEPRTWFFLAAGLFWLWRKQFAAAR
jgi:hypothetical protein